MGYETSACVESMFNNAITVGSRNLSNEEKPQKLCCALKGGSTFIYVCAGGRGVQNLHVVCAGCWTGWQAVGHIPCPVCRSTEMEPLIGPEDLEDVSLLWRTAFHACKGTKWLIDRLLEYFNWGSESFYRAFIVSYVTNCILTLFLCPNFMTGNVEGSTFIVWSELAANISPVVVSWDRDPAFPQGEEWFDAEFQSDDMDRVVEPGAAEIAVNTSVINSEHNMDRFVQCVQISLNVEDVHKWC